MKPSWRVEKKLWRRGFKLVAGLDEVGRGALAGPIVAAVVIFSQLAAKNKKLKETRDSKLLTPKKRKILSQEIKKNALTWMVASLKSKIIDQKGINWANQEVMRRVVKKMKIKPDYLLIDGQINLDCLKIPYQSVIKADLKIFSCASASILAKTWRDQIMEKLHQKFPRYNLIKNKGYGTKEHYQKLKIFGPSPYHRQSFRLK